jgi:hypothetical protein
VSGPLPDPPLSGQAPDPALNEGALRTLQRRVTGERLELAEVMAIARRTSSHSGRSGLAHSEQPTTQVCGWDLRNVALACCPNVCERGALSRAASCVLGI